jgi:hypothetical protein
MKLARLFDHLVSAGEHCPRNGDTKRLGGLEIDDQIELRWSHEWLILRLLSLENTDGVISKHTISFLGTRAIAHEATGNGVLSLFINRKQIASGRQLHDFI